MNKSPEYYYLKGVIAELTKEQQNAVETIAEKLRAMLISDEAQIALALVGMELQMKEP